MSARDVEVLRGLWQRLDREGGKRFRDWRRWMGPETRDYTTALAEVDALSAAISALEALERQGVIVATGEPAPACVYGAHPAQGACPDLGEAYGADHAACASASALPEATTCPKCSSPILVGYGIAGGGFGPYRYCNNDGCTFFEKTFELPKPPPSEDSKADRLRALTASLGHMQWCRSCAEGPWEQCDEGRKAYRLINPHKSWCRDTEHEGVCISDPAEDSP